MSAFFTNYLRRRRIAGDAPVTCMVIIIAIIAGCIGGYYYFFHNKALENAGKEVTVVNKTSATAFNAYRLRVRDRLLPAVKQLNRDTRKCLNPIIRAKGSPSDSESALKEIGALENSMRDMITEVNSQECPKQFVDMHRNLAKVVGLDWQAAVSVRKAMKSDDPREREMLLKEAHKNLAKARGLANSAQGACNRMFK